MRVLFACVKFLAFFVLCAVVVPIQTVILLLNKGPIARVMPHLWFNAVRMIFGIRLKMQGKPHTTTQTLYVSNHMSYMDIPVIGSILKTSFVSRGDVASWPFFGYLANLGQTAYVARSRSSVQSDSNAVNERIANGSSLVVFPEGTSTDGQEILAFKSSLFSLVIGQGNDDLHIQPLTLQVMSVDGHVPETQEDRDVYAWHRDMDTELFAHLWGLALHRGAVLSLTFHPPILAKDYQDRKILAKACHDTVSNGLESFTNTKQLTAA